MGVLHRPGEGESLFGGRIVLKAAFEQLCITESWFDSARDGAGPHIHKQHVDSFYVLEGELAVLVDDEEVLLGPGGFASAPPELVHGFRTTMPTRFLNFHTPDGGFAENLRDRNRGGPGGFDSIDVPPGSGRPGSDGIVLRAGEGERLETDTRVATIKVGRDELSLIEFELEPTFEGPKPAHPRRHRRLLLRARGRGRVPARRREGAARRRLVRRRGARRRAHVRTAARTAAGCSTSTRRAAASTTGFGRTPNRVVCSDNGAERRAIRSEERCANTHEGGADEREEEPLGSDLDELGHGA